MSKKAARKINHSHSLANRSEADNKSANARDRDGLGKTGHKVGKSGLTNNKQNKS